ncbi:MAG: PIN domain-containing protein [Coriobacteriia bacterium]|nr:PIN domain-containing protein [Coriobacteriia bacterium]
MINVLVDSNVAIDFLARRPGFYEDARKLFVFGAMGDYQLWMSSSQLTDLFYILTEGKAFERARGKERMRQLLRFVRVCSIDEGDVVAALDSPWDDFEDALVHKAALKMNASALVTRDEKGFAASFVRTCDAAGFLQWMEGQNGISYAEVEF